MRRTFAQPRQTGQSAAVGCNVRFAPSPAGPVTGVSEWIRPHFGVVAPPAGKRCDHVMARTCVDERVRHAGRHAGQVRAFGRDLPVTNDIGDLPAQHDMALFNRMGMQGRPAVRLRFGQHKGKPIEPVIFAMNRIPNSPGLS